MVELDAELADRQVGQDLGADGHGLRVGDHERERARDVKVTLGELAVPPARELRVVAAVDLADVVALWLPTECTARKLRNGTVRS